MLNMIKDAIKKQTALQESADLIIGDTLPRGAFDESIVLSDEFNDFDYDALTEAEDEPEIDTSDVETEDTDENIENTEEPTSNVEDKDDDIMDQSIDDGEDTTRDPEPIDTNVDGNADGNTGDDILDQPIDGGDDALPTTDDTSDNEPEDDILSMEIDMGSNTPKDILPVPPASAGDAVADSDDTIMNQHIDSGFGGEDTSVEGDTSNEDTSIENIEESYVPKIIDDIPEEISVIVTRALNDSKDKGINKVKSVVNKANNTIRWNTSSPEKIIEAYIIDIVISSMNGCKYLNNFIDHWNNGTANTASTIIPEDVILKTSKKHSISVNNIKNALNYINKCPTNMFDKVGKGSVIKALNKALHHVQDQGYSESTDIDDNEKLEAFQNFMDELRNDLITESDNSLRSDIQAAIDDTNKWADSTIAERKQKWQKEVADIKSKYAGNERVQQRFLDIINKSYEDSIKQIEQMRKDRIADYKSLPSKIEGMVKGNISEAGDTSHVNESAITESDANEDDENMQTESVADKIKSAKAAKEIHKGGTQDGNPFNYGIRYLAKTGNRVTMADLDTADDEADTKDEDDAKAEAFSQFVKDMQQKAFTEEISIGGDDSAPADDTTEAPAEDASTDVSTDSAPAEDTSSEEESPVTTAVKDKVAESDSADAITTATGASSQQEIMNKLSNITKNLEDVKKSIMQSIQ